MHRTSSPGRQTSRTAIAHVGGAALAIAAAAVPMRASHAQGISLAIPPNAPSLLSFQAAAVGTNNPTYATDYGLVPLTDAAGNELTESTATGVGATAYLDPVGNVIVAYAWDTTPAESTLSHGDPLRLRPIGGAGLRRRGDVPEDGRGRRRRPRHPALEGLSDRVLAGGHARVLCRLAERAARHQLCRVRHSWLRGAGDGRRQLHQLRRGERSGRPVRHRHDRERQREGGEPAHGPLRHGDRPGGTECTEEREFTSNITGFTLPEFFAGTLPVSGDQIGLVEGEYDDLLGPNHQMSLYNPDSYALAAAYGVSPSAP